MEDQNIGDRRFPTNEQKHIKNNRELSYIDNMIFSNGQVSDDDRSGSQIDFSSSQYTSPNETESFLHLNDLLTFQFEQGSNDKSLTKPKLVIGKTVNRYPDDGVDSGRHFETAVKKHGCEAPRGYLGPWDEVAPQWKLPRPNGDVFVLMAQWDSPNGSRVEMWATPNCFRWCFFNPDGTRQWFAGCHFPGAHSEYTWGRDSNGNLSYFKVINYDVNSGPGTIPAKEFYIEFGKGNVMQAMKTTATMSENGGVRLNLGNEPTCLYHGTAPTSLSQYNNVCAS